MNYKLVLEFLGLVENVDFSLTEESFIMLDKTRMVESGEFIHHEAIDPVFETVYHEYVPAVLDEEGVEITPEVIAWDEQVLITSGVEAWNEPVMIEESYTPNSPAQEILDEAWKSVQIQSVDVAQLVNAYLEDKNELRHPDDSINIVNGLIHTWSYVNIPAPTKDELLSFVAVVNTQNEMNSFIDQKSKEGLDMEQDCVKCLQFITGYNDGRITGDQIITMMQTFGNINTALQNRMPKSAKKLLSLVNPDGTIVTEELRDGCLFILRKYPLI